MVLLLAVLLLLLLVAPCLNCFEAVKKPPPVAFKVMCLLPITILQAWAMLVLNLPFKALMFLTLMRPSLDLVGLGGKSAANKGKETRDFVAAAFPELTAWEGAGAGASSAGMVDAGFE